MTAVSVRGAVRLPRGTPNWWREAVGAATWASVLVTVLLWVSNRGVQQLSPVASGLISMGRLAGLLAADLLLVQVLLMARVPVVERAFGQDELARRHRSVGFASFNLLVVHITMLTIGYALQAGLDPVRQIVEFVVEYPGLWAAVAATGLFVMVVVSSVRIARAKMQYESWHLLHLYAYLGVGLSVPHEVWAGADFTSSPIARVYWWTLYALAAGSVLVWRFGVPIQRSMRHGLTVHRVEQESAGIVSVYMRGTDLGKLGASAGQFFTWRFLDGHGWTRGHPFSLSAAPRPDELRITVKDLGGGSRRLARLRPGTRVLIEGPYGRLHAGVRTRDRVTLIASGIGITPMRALLEELDDAPGEVTLIYRASTQQELVFREELDEIASRTGASVHYVLGPRLRRRTSWLPESAANLSDSQALLGFAPHLSDSDVYICGALGWMTAVRDAAYDAGVSPEQVHLERFSW